MSDWFWYLWQLPQHLLGLVVYLRFRHEGKVLAVISPKADKQPHHTFEPYACYEAKSLIAAQANHIPGTARNIKQWKIILVEGNPNMGAVSLGKYIICNYRQPVGLLIAHERGHQLQSRRLGPLYLLVVGVPSMARMLRQQKHHVNWSRAARKLWYESGWPESAANKHGGVTVAQWLTWVRATA